MRAERKSDTMMTASEYSYMTDARKREYALAVDVMENLCRDSISLLHRMQTALFNGDNDRGTPIRVRRPGGFVSLEMLAAKAAAQMARAEEAQETIPEDGNTALPTRKRAAARMRH